MYVDNAPAAANAWVPTSVASKLSFKPASNYEGQAVFTYTATNKGLLSSSAVAFVVPVAAPLPVELVDFQAVAQGPRALLTWRTASETASDYFAVERSLDGLLFAELGRVPSQGRAASYTYNDTLAASQQVSTVYYRLRQVDYGGRAAYSPTRTVAFGGIPTTVTIGSLPTIVQVYPNPATTEIRALLPVAGAHLVVYTLTGQPVAETYTTATEGVVDTRQLSGGTYLLLVQPGTGPSTYYKFIKQ
ncbi:MAG: T9SS type A sorting domain-containing protein [Hymenobacter sp.]